MKSKPNTNNLVYVPPFIKDMEEGVSYFIQYNAARVNMDQTICYLNPYGYAYENVLPEMEAQFIQIKLVSKGVYSLADTLILDAEVVAQTPAQPMPWLKVPIEAMPIAAIPSAVVVDKTITDETIKESWKDTALSDCIGEVFTYIRSLQDAETPDICGLHRTKAYKNVLLWKITNLDAELIADLAIKVIVESLEIINNYLDLEDPGERWGLLEDSNKEEIIVLCNRMRDAMNQKNKALSAPKKAPTKLIEAKKTIQELSLSELRLAITKYTKQEKEDYLETLESDPHEKRYEKAAIVRDNME